jgi:hypothetical protein
MKKTKKSTTKLNFYYIPKKSQHKLKSVIPVEPIIVTNNDFMIDLLLLNIWDDKSVSPEHIGLR